MRKLRGIGAILFLTVFLGCNKDEPMPSYIHIDKFTKIVSDPFNNGSASHKILDAWVYIDDQLVGAFEMPFTIPVLYAGEHTIKVLPGIKENGISETRIPYPFYETYVLVATLVPGEILTLNPVTDYAQAAEVVWLEEFEGVHSFCMNNPGDQDTLMKIVPASDPAAFEGSSGGFFITGASSYFTISCNKYVLPKGNAAVFLELNYNCNTEMNVGIVGYSGSSIEFQKIALTLRPTNGWNKVYVNLTNDVTAATSSSEFAIFFSMLKDPELSTSYAYLDNIKLIK